MHNIFLEIVNSGSEGIILGSGLKIKCASQKMICAIMIGDMKLRLGWDLAFQFGKRGKETVGELDNFFFYGIRFYIMLRSEPIRITEELSYD